MIGTLLRVSWTNLKRDRVAQALTFLLPVLFFSIFATVFGNQGDATSRVRIAVVDEDGSELSQTRQRCYNHSHVKFRRGMSGFC